MDLEIIVHGVVIGISHHNKVPLQVYGVIAYYSQMHIGGA
jgi:hypothetical protein